jgi:ABC-type sugar transport system ATPase subunit
MTAPTPVLDVSGVTKRYGHVEALRGVDLQVRPGEVHALVGDNGAGKSTLMKVIAGAVTPDSGVVKVRGERMVFTKPADAQAAGIETVYQDLSLAQTLTPGENLYLGREILRKGFLGRLGFIDRAAMNRSAKDQLTRLGASLQSLTGEVGSLSGGQKQAVAVARASLWGTALVMLDEPTAALGVSQTDSVLRLIQQLRDERGLSVVLVSHSMPDVFRVSDRITVLRLGRTVLTADTASLSTNELIAAMTGAGSSVEPVRSEGVA